VRKVTSVTKFLATRLASWLALPAGAAVSFAFAPFGWWPLGILATAYLFALWQEATPRRAAGAGFLVTAGTFLAGTYWLYHSVYEIGHAPIVLTYFVIAIIAAVMGTYTAILGYVLARWVRVQGAVRWLLVLPSAVAVVEWFRGWFLSGFPWLQLGYTQTDAPLAGIAPLGGLYAVSFAVALSAGALVAFLFGNSRARITAACGVAGVWILGFSLWGHEWTQRTGTPVTVAIVQGAIPQEMKLDQSQFEHILDVYHTLTQPHLGAQIIVWPESALAAPVDMLGGFLGPQWDATKRAGSTLVLGQLRRDPRRDVYYNAVLALGDEPQWYAKRRLVPLAEFFPVPDWMRDWLKGMELPYSGFEAGGDSQPALDAAGQKLGISICYEDSYASDQLAVLKEATLLVNVTNDAWFGDSTAAHQHLQISRMRALEAGRMLLRAANDGISAIIGPDGRVTATLPRFQPGVLTGSVQPRIGLTPYARAGNWPVVVFSLAILLGGLAHGVQAALRSRRRFTAEMRQS
jgi:apolipoprotein N-acyltransferase